MTRTHRVWTVPNVLSMLRLAGCRCSSGWCWCPRRTAGRCWCWPSSGVTDFLDGYLARRLGQHSTVGEILDPVADRLYILAVIVGLALRDVIPWWVAIALPLRDALLWGLVPLLRTRGYSSLPVHFLGKAATFNLLYAFRCCCSATARASSRRSPWSSGGVRAVGDRAVLVGREPVRLAGAPTPADHRATGDRRG